MMRLYWLQSELSNGTADVVAEVDVARECVCVEGRCADSEVSTGSDITGCNLVGINSQCCQDRLSK